MSILQDCDESIKQEAVGFHDGLKILNLTCSNSRKTAVYPAVTRQNSFMRAVRVKLHILDYLVVLFLKSLEKDLVNINKVWFVQVLLVFRKLIFPWIRFFISDYTMGAFRMRLLTLLVFS